MNGLVYPTLDLFLYDFRSGVGNTQAQVQENQQKFKDRLPNITLESLFERDQSFDPEYLELLQPSSVPFEKERDSLPLQGYYYPVRLGDSYGLLIDCSIDDRNNAQSVGDIVTLKTEIGERLRGEGSTLGQTWMVSGWLPRSDSDNPESMARVIYDSLFPDADWIEDFQSKGKFLGSTVFELWNYRLMSELDSRPQSIHDIQFNRHVVIIIYANRDVATAVAPNFYADWMRLFYYRNKVLWAYSQSQWLSYKSKQHFAALGEVLTDLQSSGSAKVSLNRAELALAEAQRILNEYNNSLIYLNFQSHTLDVNIDNYQQRIIRMSQKTTENSDFSFLRIFENIVFHKYQKQISKDYKSLTLGVQLLDSSLSTLRSRIEISQAKRDRLFQDTAAILGVGFAIASIAGKPDEVCFPSSNPVLSIVEKSPICQIQLFYGLFMGGTAALITWLLILALTRIRQSRSRKT